MMIVTDISTMAQSVLDELLERKNGARNFMFGPATDTKIPYGFVMPDSDKRLLLAYRELIDADLVAETKTHMRSRSSYISAYRANTKGAA